MHFPRILLVVVFPALALGCGREYKLKPKKNLERLARIVPAQVELISSQAPGGSLLTAWFSFRSGMRSDVSQRGEGELLFEAGSGGQGDFFKTQTAASQVAAIVDLGEVACKDLPHGNEAAGACPRKKGHGGYPHREDRAVDPMFWLQYSEAWALLRQGGEPQAAVQSGHCYLLHWVSDAYRVVAAFHVKAHAQGKSVTLDELEIFDHARITRD